MSWIVTPRRLAHRAECYHQLGQLTNAGVSLRQAIEMAGRNPASRSDRLPLTRIARHLQEGGTFHEALLRTGSWMPAFDQALLQAGELSGHLPECFGVLANHYTERARMARQVLGDLGYPLLLLHAAVFLLPLPSLVLTGSVAGYATRTLGVIVPLYLAVFGLMYALHHDQGRRWRALLENALGSTPVLGTARRALALARLSLALRALLNAGISIVEAWRLAAEASGSPALQDTVASWKTDLRDGHAPGRMIAESAQFPEVFANLYQTGEVSGTLDDSLQKLYEYYQEEGTRKFRLVAEWLPRAAYLLIAGVVAWQVIQRYTSIFQQYDQFLTPK